MASFMDKVKQQYESAVKGMARQPQELSEIERVVENMVQIEAQIQSKFTQLGQCYYMEHQNQDDLEEQYQRTIEEIRKLDENRRGFYAHKLRLEGNMMCVNCGEIIPYGSVYCSKCGKRADRKEE